MLDVGELLDDRWEIDGHARPGGQSDVWPARDRLDGRRVAIKLLRGATTEEVLRGERELRALELLKVPGVVRLRGSGRLGPWPYLVLGWVDGEPFPRGTWDELRPRLASLLGILAEVHAQRVIHRDIKPENVLVTGSAQVTLIDFGLARGRALGEPLTATREVCGTPPFVPPEAWEGEEPGVAADLYAVGVLAWHALTGTYPWPGTGPELVRLRDADARPPSAHLPPDARPLLQRLCSLDTRSRPESATAALQLLLEPHRARPLPFLGREAPLEACLNALRSGRGVTIGGPRGSGRTRLLQELDRRLGDEGTSVRWIPPGDRPLASLFDAGFPRPLTDDPDVAEAALRDALASHLRSEVLLVDDIDRVDEDSRRLLDRPGPIARAGAEGDVRLDPLTVEDLERLFSGPERLVHLRSAPAWELHRRTGGHPAAIVGELAAWERSGLARREEERYRLTEANLGHVRAGVRVGRIPGHAGPLSPPQADVLAVVALLEPLATPALIATLTGQTPLEVGLTLRELRRRGVLATTVDGQLRDLSSGSHLARWSEDRRELAHRRVAHLLTTNTPERLVHALRGRHPEAARIAMEVVSALAAQGDTALACSTAANAQAWLAPHVDEEFVRAWILAAFEAQERRPLEELRPHTGGAERQLVDAAILAYTDGERALLAADATRIADSRLESWRQSVRASAASRIARDTFLRVARDAAGALDRLGETARALALLGRVAYLEGNLEEALRLHRAARDARTRPGGQLATASAIGSVLLDLGRWAEARLELEAARALARRWGHTLHEVRAEWLLRRVDYQSCVATRPDLDLIEAAQELGPPYAGLLLLTEATIAWRAGLPNAADLATEAAGLLQGGNPEPLALAAALATATGRPTEGPSCNLAPGVALQVAALRGAPTEAFAVEGDPERRREILSWRECREGWTCP